MRVRAPESWRAVGLGLGVTAGVVLAPRLFLRLVARELVVTDPAELGRHEAAVVLGAGVLPDGSPSWMLSDRVDAGVALLRAGTVGRVLLSGDAVRPGYDEVGPMTALARHFGAPAADLLLDPRGVSTSASCRNAADAFALRDAVLVTQRFHADRAAWLAASVGIGGTVLALPDRWRYGRRVTYPLVLREVAAAWKALAEGTAARARRWRRTATRKPVSRR